MSQGSPFKQDRIEKHLARQRGAGVRNLATSFGFSFGFQPSTTEQQDIEERPAKRRKSAHSHLNKTEYTPTAQPENCPVTKEHQSPRRKAAKRKQPRRFEVASDDDDRLETVVSRNPADHNDTFIVIKKPAAKRGRPKKGQATTRATAVEERAAEVHESHSPTASKRGRPRKIESTTDQVELASSMGREDATTRPTMSMRNRGRPQKTLVAEEPEVVTNRPDSSKSTVSASRAIAIPPHQHMDGATGSVETPTAEEPSKPLVKKRGRPRKARTEAITHCAKMEHGVAIIDAMKELSKTRTARQTHQEPEHVAAESSRRPRRQAAATAMSKVSEGFIEEEAPIDKKRRDPDLQPVSRRGRKKILPSAIPSDASDSNKQIDTVVIESIADNGHVASTTCEDAVVVSSRDLPPQLPVLAGTKTIATRRTKSRPIVLADSVRNKTEEVPDAVPWQSHRVTKRTPLSETETNIAMPAPSPEKPTEGNKVTSRGHQKRFVDVGRRLRTTAVVRDNQDAQDAGPARTARKARVVKQVDHTIQKQSERDKSLRPKSGCYPEALASGLRSSTEHAVPEQDVIIANEQPSVRARAKPATIADVAPVTAVAPIGQREARKEDRPATYAVASPGNKDKRPHPRNIKASKPDTHKVDCLFENTNVRRSPRTKKKRTLSKRRVDKVKNSDVTEMDLDDLLSNIASFVPKSMRA